MTQMIGTSDADQNAGLAMTLAAITYSSDIPGCLARFAPGWSVVWKADQSVGGNFAYIAFNGSSQYVVAIRGSVPKFDYDGFENWIIQDLNVIHQVPWLFPPNSPGVPLISAGSSIGLTNLTNLVQVTPGSASQTMWDFLSANAIGNGMSIGVVGHSLGGNLANVFAPWLLYQIEQAGQTPPGLFPVFTFAAPTPGNTAFAQFFDAGFGRSWRYYNVNDIVPRASGDICGMGNLYNPAPQASQIVQDFKIPLLNWTVSVSLQDAFCLVAGALSLAGLQYSSTNLQRGSVPLNTSNMLGLIPPTITDPLVQWFYQAATQHATNTYLGLLGASPVTCSSDLPLVYDLAINVSP